MGHYINLKKQGGTELLMQSKSIIIILILFLLLNSQLLFGNFARSEILKYGFTALGDDISTILYNPAGLVYLPEAYSELGISTDKKFHYNNIGIGYFLDRFKISKNFVSINLAFGMNQVNSNENFLISLGGTLYNDIKYGLSFKYNILQTKTNYLDFDIGTIFVIAKWLNYGLVFKNLRNKTENPFNIMSGISIFPFNWSTLVSGININNKLNQIIDYNFAIEINPFQRFSFSVGMSEDNILGGIGINFSKDTYKNSRTGWKIYSCFREKLFITTYCDKNTKKFTKIIVSFYYKFYNLFHKPYILNIEFSKARQESSKDKTTEEIGVKRELLEILEEQKDRLEVAKIYFSQERLYEAKEEIKIILKLNKRTKYAKEARKLLRKIEKIEKKLYK